MNFYTGLQSTATTLLRQKGQAMTLRRTVPTSSDPVAGTVTPATPVDFTVRGVLTSYKDTLVDDTTIKRGDRQALIEAGVVEPAKDDRLIITGQTWTILDVDAVNPAGTPLLYKLQVRR